MKKESVLIGLILLFSQAAHAKALKLALNWKPEPQFGGFYSAQVEGIFKKKSIDVEIIPGGAGTPTIQVVSAGQAEFGVVSAEEVPLSRSHGSDIVALFAVYQINPAAIMAHAEQGFRSIQDIFNFNGTLAVQKGLPYFLFLEKKLGKAKTKIVPTLGGVSNFLIDPSFSQQVLVTSEPILVGKKGVKTTNFKISDEGFNPYLTVLVTRKAFIEMHPEAVKTMVAAVREGWRVYLDRPAKANGFMHQLNPSMDEQTFKESAAAQKDLIETKVTQEHGLGFMTRERWRTLVDQLKMIGLIDRLFEVNDLYRNL